VEIKTMKIVLAAFVLFLGLGAVGCGSNTTSNTGGSTSATGGASGQGGAQALGGSTGSGGSNSSPDASGALDQTAFGQKFKFADNAISGWTMDPTDPTAYFIFTGEDGLIGRIDGAAGAYTDRGCRVGMYQDLVYSDGSMIEIVAMDYVTEAQATAMFTWKKNDQSATIPIPPYSPQIAIGSSNLTGLGILAHFKAYYFELTLSGYGPQTTTCSACTVAKQFLDALQSKTN
jgi:hypothetical protein